MISIALSHSKAEHKRYFLYISVSLVKQKKKNVTNRYIKRIKLKEKYLKQKFKKNVKNKSLKKKQKIKMSSL